MKIQLQAVLKRELKARRMTINGLAKACGIPVSVLHGWVQGVLPSARNLHHIAAISKVLGLPVNVLLFNNGHNGNNGHSGEGRTRAEVVFTSEYLDRGRWYRITVEKVPERNGE